MPKITMTNIAEFDAVTLNELYAKGELSPVEATKASFEE